MIVYRGISLLDGVTPIVVVLTGLDRASKNEKTGGMVQAYILVAGWTAQGAIGNGSDYSICGDCPKRGDHGKGRTCYVSLATGLSTVSRQLAKGAYPHVDLAQAAKLLEGKQLRVGTYGDPAAIPIHVWQTLLARTRGHTGYTHQWRAFPALASFLMASVDTPAEYEQAKASGWRCFRVRQDGEDLDTHEITCPASSEAGHRVTCADCGLCQGNGRPAKDIAILDHSVQAIAKRRRLPMLQVIAA